MAGFCLQLVRCGDGGDEGTDAADTGVRKDATPDTGTPDAGDDFDTGTVTDSGAPDPDGGMRDAEADGGLPAVCEEGSLIDLNADGIRTGTVTHYLGENDSASISTLLQAPSCVARASREVVFRYAPYASTRLSVSTNFAGTSTDTVVWVLDACASGGATELGCNDDLFAPPVLKASAVSTGVVPMGVPLYIVVAGYFGAHGTFDLAVTELSSVPVGADCDLAELTNYCEGVSQCLPDAPTGTSDATCVLDGTLSGVCRAAGTACDADLACNGPQGDFGSRCVPALANGAACDPAGRDNVCIPPGQCITDGGGSSCAAAPYLEALSPLTFIDACAVGTTIASFVGSSSDVLDDGHAAAAIPIAFAFEFFGQAETMLWPVTNGYALFGAAEPGDFVGGGPSALPNLAEGAVAAPLWQDLILRPATTICYATVGAAPNRQLVIEWSDATSYSSSDQMTTHLTFELVLSETSFAVDFLYQTLDADPADVAQTDGSQAAIGVQSAMGASFTAHLGLITPASGIRFTPR